MSVVIFTFRSGYFHPFVDFHSFAGCDLFSCSLYYFTFAISFCISQDNRSGSVMYVFMAIERQKTILERRQIPCFWTHVEMVTGKLFKDTNITVVPRRGSQELSNKV